MTPMSTAAAGPRRTTPLQSPSRQSSSPIFSPRARTPGTALVTATSGLHPGSAGGPDQRSASAATASRRPRVTASSVDRAARSPRRSGSPPKRAGWPIGSGSATACVPHHGRLPVPRGVRKWRGCVHRRRSAGGLPPRCGRSGGAGSRRSGRQSQGRCRWSSPRRLPSA